MHLPPIAPTLPQLPPGSALRFQSEQADPRPSRSRALMNNVEHQMTHLLGWAGGDAAALRRTRVEPTVSAHERREEVRTFLRGRADVHQKRARRRELPEPSGTMRLPREAARMRPRQGMEREVSYLSDRKTRNHRDVNDVRDIPDSLIPDTFRISLEAPLPMSHGLFAPDSAMANAWELNPGTRKWELPIFPSKLPAGRRDVVLLHSWVNDMLMRLKQSSKCARPVHARRRAAPPMRTARPATARPRVTVRTRACSRQRAQRGRAPQRGAAALLCRVPRDHPPGVGPLPRARPPDG